MSDNLPNKILVYEWRTHRHRIFYKHHGPSFYLMFQHFGGTTVSDGDYIGPGDDVLSSRWVEQNTKLWRALV